MSTKSARVEFNDKLISSVQRHPILWDSSRKDFKDHRKKAEAWAEVATEIGCDPQDNNIQARWKSLRDTFTKKHRAWKDGAPSGSGAADAVQVRWPYFHLMMFLKDQVDIGNTISNSHVQQLDTAESLLESVYSETDEEQLSRATLPSRSTSPDMDAANRCSLREISAATRATPQSALGKRKRQEKSRWQNDIDKVDAMISEDRDQASVYGQLVAHKLRACPKHAKHEMEMELINFIAKYSFPNDDE